MIPAVSVMSPTEFQAARRKLLDMIVSCARLGSTADSIGPLCTELSALERERDHAEHEYRMKVGL
jgi:hypothetical protein